MSQKDIENRVNKSIDDIVDASLEKLALVFERMAIDHETHFRNAHKKQDLMVYGALSGKIEAYNRAAKIARSHMPSNKREPLPETPLVRPGLFCPHCGYRHPPDGQCMDPKIKELKAPKGEADRMAKEADRAHDKAEADRRFGQPHFGHPREESKK